MKQHILEDVTISGLPNHYKGKVRDCYDLPDGRRIMITTDRMSAFDQPICAVPEKGRVLTKCSALWFRRMEDICPNHVIDYPDSNVLICKKLEMLPIEVVVRDYLAGTTNTSILHMYRCGARQMYGHTLPNGMRDYQKLPYTMITPTTKADDHDAPLVPTDLNQLGIDAELWTAICRTSLALFARASEMVAKNGLILADTKFEFGFDNGVLTLADEIFTPDSSRFWFAENYQNSFDSGVAPVSFDKDVIRRWIAKRCDPYNGPIPEVPKDIINLTSEIYMDAYEKITGMIYTPYCADIPILNRIKAALHLAGVLDNTTLPT